MIGLIIVSCCSKRTYGFINNNALHHESLPLHLHSRSRTLLFNTNTNTNTNSNSNNEDTELIKATSRFPTSPEDQVRQASIAISQASQNGIKRHSIRLLLPIIGATELDDWPGGARQMMDAASPLIQDVLTLVYNQNKNDEQQQQQQEQEEPLKIQESIIDQSDGVRALFSQGANPIDDACAILLPSADTVSTIQSYDDQVGVKRNLLLVNTQWKRKSDFGNGGGANNGVGGFGSFFGGNGNSNSNTSGSNKADDKIEYVQGYEPTFHCSNVMVEGDIVRVLRTYPGPWRVYLRVVDEEDESNIDWVEIGTKDIIQTKTQEWEKEVIENGGNSDGGKIFDYGMPSYRDIEEMIVTRDGYVPKSVSQRAASAFTFIKDSL